MALTPEEEQKTLQKTKENVATIIEILTMIRDFIYSTVKMIPTDYIKKILIWGAGLLIIYFFYITISSTNRQAQNPNNPLGSIFYKFGFFENDAGLTEKERSDTGIELTNLKIKDAKRYPAINQIITNWGLNEKDFITLKVDFNSTFLKKEDRDKLDYVKNGDREDKNCELFQEVFNEKKVVARDYNNYDWNDKNYGCPKIQEYILKLKQKDHKEVISICLISRTKNTASMIIFFRNKDKILNIEEVCKNIKSKFIY